MPAPSPAPGETFKVELKVDKEVNESVPQKKIHCCVFVDQAVTPETKAAYSTCNNWAITYRVNNNNICQYHEQWRKDNNAEINKL